MVSPMTRLTPEQLEHKVAFIEQYLKAENAASGSTVDANANVSNKNIATMEAEINKDINVQINQALLASRIAEMFGSELAAEFHRQVEAHEIYVHDSSSLKPYCVSVTLYPFLYDGLTKLGGESKAPTHIDSFCGSFVNLVFAIASQFAGAVATVEWLAYMNYFAEKTYGRGYLDTHMKEMKAHFQHVVYAINQPAAARGYQSVFWNISLYDEPYFNGLFENFVFPDGSAPNYRNVKKLQDVFLTWFNAERKRAVLTFPVVTAAMLTANGEPVDHDFADMCAIQMSKGNSFFVYMSEDVDSLSSCCRLRSAVTDRSFSYSLGAGGVATGSINVITLNMNRLEQDAHRSLVDDVKKIQKYQLAYRSMIEDWIAAKMLPVYDAGFISINKQFVTIGINGLVEAAEYRGIEISDNPEYIKFLQDRLGVIHDLNNQFRKEHNVLINCEMVPAENLGVKFANWDKKDGYTVPRDCYNSYFYVVENESLNVLDKFALHGDKVIKYLDGGSALHLNLASYLSIEGFRQLFNVAARSGCNYWCTNVLVTMCRDCGTIDKQTKSKCGSCGSENVDWMTRVIGYLKPIKSFSAMRQVEAHKRFYHVK